jgi:aminopeptidase N
MKPKLTSCLIIIILLYSSLAYSRESFTWPGSQPIEKSFKPDHFSHPSEALFDSAHAFDALHYRLDLNFLSPGAYFSGSMTLRFRVVDDGLTQIRLNMIALAADSAFVGAAPTSFSRDDTSIIVNLDAPYSAGETLSVRIAYRDTLNGRGYFYYPWNSYTMSEPQDARWWFPCYDEPWDKATSEIYAIVQENSKVGSNGYLADVIHDPVNHTRAYHWVNEYPIATYLISLVFGDYATWTDYYIRPNGDSVPIFYMVTHDDSANAAYDFATIPQMMAIYSDLFGSYPFNKYGQASVGPFNYGAMENQTLTTINEGWITGDRICEAGYAHELGHMWWGDYVTLADWRNIWLNEGFASYSFAIFDEAFHGHAAFIGAINDQEAGYMEYERNSGRREPIYNPTDMFGIHVYNKGSLVLHMLRGLLGDSIFFSGMRQYATAHAYSNANTQEYQASMENSSGQGLDWFFNEWVYDRGYPVYNYAWSYQASGDSFLVHLDIAQVQTDAPVFRMPLTIRIVAGGNHDFSVQNSLAIQSYEFVTASQPETLILDPDHWVIRQIQQVTGIDNSGGSVLPIKAEINNIYPNPFNGEASISFSVDGRAQQIGLTIYDLLGRQIRLLESGRFEPNNYLISWNGRDQFGHEMASGIYLVRLITPNQSSTKKITYIR